MIINSNMRGRNKTLAALRDKALAARYYYWTELQRRRFDDVIYILQHHEFFIGEQRLGQVIRDQNEYISELISKRKTADQLAKEFQSFNFKS